MLQTIIFSKNRPSQLSYFLQSLQFLEGLKNSGPITVLWTSSSPEDYDKYQLVIKYASYVMEEYNIKFVEQTNFYQDLTTIMADHPYTLFGVDDGLYYNYINIDQSIDFLNKNPAIFSHSLRLHPNVTYCHPAGQENVVPNIHIAYRYPGIGFYNTRQGRYDWCYAFELCATILRTNFVQEVLERFKTDIANPNNLEALGHTLWISRLLEDPDQYSHAGCLLYEAFCVPTINRVQDEYKNPIYTNEVEKDKLSIFTSPNYSWYRSQKFNRIHVPELKLNY